MPLAKGTEQFRYLALVSQCSEHSDLQSSLTCFLGLAAEVSLNWCYSGNYLYSSFDTVVA